MLKSPEEYLSFAAFETPVTSDREIKLTSGERTFVEKYLGLDALQLMPELSPESVPLPQLTFKTPVSAKIIEVAETEQVLKEDTEDIKDIEEKSPVIPEITAESAQLRKAEHEKEAYTPVIELEKDIPKFEKEIITVSETDFGVEKKLEICAAEKTDSDDLDLLWEEVLEHEDKLYFGNDTVNADAAIEKDIREKDIEDKAEKEEVKEAAVNEAQPYTEKEKAAEQIPEKTETVEAAETKPCAETITKNIETTAVAEKTVQAVQVSLKERLRTEKEIQMVSFYVENQIFLLPVAAIQEVIRHMELIKIPQAPEFVAGAINLRGRVMPIVYLSALLTNNTEYRYDDKNFIIVCGSKELQLGLIIDKISSMHILSQQKIIWNADAKLGDAADFLYAIADINDKVCGIVSPETIAQKILAS